MEDFIKRNVELWKRQQVVRDAKIAKGKAKTEAYKKRKADRKEQSKIRKNGVGFDAVEQAFDDAGENE